MKIALYTSLNEYTGIGNYTRKLCASLKQMPDVDVERISGQAKMDRNNLYTKVFSGVRRLYAEQYKIPQAIRADKFDIYHITQNLGVPFIKKGKTIVTIHDIVPMVYPKQYFSSKLEYLIYKKILEISIRKSDYIITDSCFSKKEIITHMHVDERKIFVVYLGVDVFNSASVLLDKEDLLNKYGIHKPYILSLGNSEYRKNVTRLVQAFHDKRFQNYQLVIIGKGNEKHAQKDIITTCNVADEDLKALYKFASIFVFPSLYEGFGLPVLEAMALGTPVITSNSSSLCEVGGDAAVYFDPLDVADMQEHMSTVLQDEQHRQMMIDLGYDRVKHFSWKKCAEETLKVYKEAMKLS